MRRVVLTSFFSILGLTIAAGLFAQAPPPPTPGTPNKVDEILFQWEKTMSGVSSLIVYCNRTTLDKTYGTTDVFEGTAKFLKSSIPGQTSRASLEMFKKGRPEVFEKYVFSGNFLYEFSPGTKTIRAHDLPPSKNGQISDDNFLSFVTGMKAVDARMRYQITLVGQDQHYHYLVIQPRQDADKADFTEARLVLMRHNHMPRQLWFRQPNSNEITWDFPKVESPADLRPEQFAQPAVPPGWKMERPQLPPASKIRNNN